MTVVNVKIGANDAVPVTLAPGVDADLDMVVKCKPFMEWAAELDPKFVIKSLIIQSVDMFGPRVGFLKFKADVTDKKGGFVPGIVFMRGGAVAVLVIIECGDEEYSLITLQPRLPIGNFGFPEIPAGMLDGSGKFSGVAAKEMEEETGLVISSEKLVDLTALVYGAKSKGFYPSAGGCDEFIRLFVYRTRMEKTEMDALQGKFTGLSEEGEQITLKVVKLDDLYLECPDSKTLAALYLYERLKKQGKVE